MKILHFMFILICALAKRTETDYKDDVKKGFKKILNITFSTNGLYELYFKNKRFYTTFHHLSGKFRDNIPETFDTREKWPYCTIAKPYNTGKCITSVGQIVIKVLSDRTCIRTKGKDRFFYSLEDLLSCCALCKETVPANSSICKELDYFIASFKHWLSVGLVSGGEYNSDQGCKPYSKEFYSQSKIEKKCRLTCTNEDYPVLYEKDKRKGKSLKVILSRDRYHIKEEMLKYGPVVSLFAVPEDFFYHEEGVYERQYGGIVGYLPVQIIGWGRENSSDKFFWLIYFPRTLEKDAKYGIFKVSQDLHIEDMVFSPHFFRRSHLLTTTQPTTSSSTKEFIGRFTSDQLLMSICVLFVCTLQYFKKK